MEDLLKSLEQRIEDIQTKAYSDIRKTYGLDEKGKSTGQVIDTKKAQEATKRLTNNGSQTNDVIDMLNAQREQQISNMKKSTETLKASRQGQSNKNKKKIAVNDAKNQQLEQQGIDYINQQADMAIEMIKQAENFQGSVDEQRKAYEFIYQALTQKAQERGQELIDRAKKLQEKKSGFTPIDTSKEEAKLATAVQKMAVDVGLSLNQGITNMGTKKPTIAKATKSKTVKMPSTPKTIINSAVKADFVKAISSKDFDTFDGVEAIINQLSKSIQSQRNVSEEVAKKEAEKYRSGFNLITKNSGGISRALSKQQIESFTNVFASDKENIQGHSAEVYKSLDALINGFNEGAKASLTGAEYRNRQKSRAGQDVSNITGGGNKGYGTTRDALATFVEEAEKKGYSVYFRRTGSEIQAMLLPLDKEYKSTDWKKENNIKVSFAVGDGTGRIAGGRINQAEVATEFIPTGKLKEDGSPEVKGVKVMETEETLQVKDATSILRNTDFTKYSSDQISHRLQSGANRAINKVSSVMMGSEAREDIQDSNTRYSGKLTELEAMRSTQYSIAREIQSTLNQKDVKEALGGYFTGKNEGYKANYNAFDPSKELTDAMANAWALAMKENLDPNTIADELVKFIMTSDAFKYYRKAAKEIGAAMPSDYTGESEGKFALGKNYTVSSRQYVPFGQGIDATQRSLTQAFDILRLSEKALASRKSSSDAMSQVITTTQQALDAGIDRTDITHKRYQSYGLTQEEFDKAEREYYKTFNPQMADESNEDYTHRIDSMLKDMTDVALVTDKIIAETESIQRNVSKATNAEDIVLDFLNQFGVDIDSLTSNEYQTGSVIDINQTVGKDQFKMFSKDFSVNEGDLLVGLEKTDNGWKLLVDRLRQVEQGVKLVDEGGRRLTADTEKQHGVSKADFVKQFWAANGKEAIANADYLTLLNDDVKERNYYSEFMGQINTIIDKALEQGSSLENIYSNLPPLLQKMFEIQTVKDENGEEKKLLVDITDEKNGVVTNKKGENVFANPNETLASFKGIEQSALAIFKRIGKSASEAQAIYDSIKGLASLGIGQHNIYPYSNASGYGSADTLERDGRVTDDWKVRNARQRSLDYITKSAAGQSNLKDREKVIAGLKSLKAQQEKQDNTYGKKGQEAQRIRQNLITANKSLNNVTDYTTAKGTKDVEFRVQDGQVVLQAGEQVYSDILTDINALRHSGKISAEEYQNFAMERARQLQKELSALEGSEGEAYARGNIVLNLSDSAIGGKKYLLGDAGAAMSPDGEYYSGAIDSANAALLQAATESQEAFEKAKQYAADVYHKLGNTKDSELVRQATHNFVPYSAFSVAAGTSKLADLTDEQANTVYISSKRLKELMSSASSATKQDRLENVNRLFSTLSAKSIKDSGQRAITSMSLRPRFENGKFTNKLSEDELNQIEEEIIGAIIGEIKSGNNTFTTEVGRYPYTQGMEGYTARLGLDESAGDTIRVSAGLAELFRGDFDGDKFRMALKVYEQYGEDEKLAEDYILKYNDTVASIMNQIQKQKAQSKKVDIDDSWNKIAQDLSRKWINKDASEQAKMAFQNVGLFSDAATKTRESMYKTGFADNNGATSAVQSALIRATMESFEQDAISSKKIYARLIGKNGMSEDQALLAVKDLVGAIHEGRFADTDDQKGFLTIAKNLNVLDEVMSGKQFETVVSQIIAGGDKAQIDTLTKMGIASVDKEGKFASFNGATMANLVEAFNSFEAFLKPMGLSLKDATNYSKALDPYRTVNGELRKDKTYLNNNGEWVRVSEDGTEETVEGSIINAKGNVIVNAQNGKVVVNAGSIDVNGATEVNTNAPVAQTSQATPQTNSIDKAANLRDAGGEWAKFIAADVVSELGEGHSRTMKVGDKTYSSEGGNLRSVTQVTTAPYEDYSKFPNTTQSGNRASALGTFAHAIVENIDNMTDELMEQLIDEVRKSPQLGGAGLSVTAEDLQRQQSRAQDVVNAARTSGAMNNSTLKELKLGGVIGNRAFAGTADALTFGQKVNGKYADVTVADWKFSNSGGEDDPRMRAARVLQASTYLRMAESEYSQVVEKLKQAQSQGKSFDDLSSDLKTRVAELGFEGFDKDTGAGDISAIIEDGEARVEAFARSFVQIIRSFTKDGQSFVETTRGKAASMATVAEGLERGSKGQGIQQDKILAETQFATTGYYQDGKEINRPQFITDRINRNAGIQTSQGNKDIKDYINNLKQQMKLQEELQRTDLKVNNSSGYEKLEQQNIRTALNEQLTLLKQQGTIYAERVKELKEMGYSQEAINKLEQQEANLQAQHQVKLAKINATYKEQRGVLETIGKTFTNSFARLVSIDVIANQLAMTVRNMFNQIMNSAKSLNAVMVDLQIASGYSYKEIQGMMLDFNTLARKVGKSTEEVATAANDWLRAGYEGQEASQLVENSMNLSVLGMIDSAKATEYLISVLKGWKLSVDEVGEVVDKLTAVDMAAAISAGDLAAAMSRANVSAQLAGSSLDRYMAMITTVSEVSQKTPETVGESFKTLYSRFQKIAATKFEVSQEEAEKEGLSQEDFSNLNEIEQVLKAVGIAVRDSVDNFRAVDDIVDDISEKWTSFTDVQKSGIATAVAGTRQRENFLILMENMDLVAKYEKIAAESAGTAAKKMEAYTSGVEAAQKRLTASLEKWALILNSSGVLETVYNGLAAVADNLTLFGAALIATAGIVGKGTLMSGAVGGAGKVAGFLGNIGQVFSGTANQSADTEYAKAAWSRMWAETSASMDSVAGEVYSSALNRAAAALSDEEKATYKIIQSTFLAQETTDRKRIAEELLNGNISDETVALLDDTTKTKLISSLKAETLKVLQAEYNARYEDVVAIRNLKDQYKDEQNASELYEQAKKRAIAEMGMTEEQYRAREAEYDARKKNFLARGALSGRNADPNYRRTFNQMGVNVGQSSNQTGVGMVASGIGGLLGMLGGTWIGSSIGKNLGGTGGQTIGMLLGGSLGGKTLSKFGDEFGNALVKARKKFLFNKELTKMLGGEASEQLSARLSGAWKEFTTTIKPSSLAGLGIMVGAAVVAGIAQGIENSKKNLQEAYNEASEAYSNALSSSANTVEYDKLAKGVDYLGNNISLTSEEYQQFLDLSNKLAEAFPELVVRTDEYGNKLVGPDGLAGKVGEVTEAVDKMVQSLKETATAKFFDNGGGFFNWVHQWLSPTDSDLSVFGQQWENSVKNISKAGNKLNDETTITGTGFDATTKGLNTKVKEQEDYVNSLTKGTEEYEKAYSELQELKKEQEAYQKVIHDSKQDILEYTDALIDYAATAEGIVDVGYKFSGLSSTIGAMDEDEQTFINAMVKIRGEDIDYTDMDDFKTQILSISQEMTEIVKNNPAIVDVYYGTGEFKTVGESAEWKEKYRKELVEALMDENGELSADGKTMLISMGYKIDAEFKGVESVHVSTPLDELLEAMGIDSDSMSGKISEEFANAVNGMTQDQYKRAFSLAQNGWMGSNIINNPQAMMNMVNGEYYSGKDLSIRTEESKRIEARSAMDENGETALTRRLRESLSSGERWDNKETIAQEFSEYGEEVWNQILNLQGELDDAGKLYGKEWQDALDTGLEEVSLSEFKDKLEYDSQSIAYELEGLFTGIDFGEDGIINTFSELKEALNSVDEIFDQIASAREEQNASGQLSLETTLELLAANEDYINALSFEGDAITLKTDAEEIMARVRLQAVQASIQATIAEKKNTLASLQNQYQQLKTSGTYQEVANATVTAANTKVEALQTESDALINEANNLEYVTRWWALYNQAKMGSITPEQYSKAKGKIEFGNQKAKQFTKTVETTQVTLDAKQTQEKLNSLQSEIDKLSGGMTYDIDENGNWTWKGKTHIGDDGQLHFDEGEIATWEHLGYKIQDMLDSGKLTQSKWKKAYTNPIKNAGKAAKDTKDKVLDLLKAYDSLIDKEWEAMKVFDENTLTPTGYTQYFEKKRASLEKLAAYYEGMMQNTNLTEEERLDAEKNYIENQKAINNLDDEEVEDKYKILELYGASINSLILMKQQLVKTSDTYEELLENQKDLNNLLQDEIDLRKEVSEWQQKLSDRELDYVKGSAWSNSSAYDAAMNASLAEIEKQIEATKASIQFNFSQAVYGYMTEGMSEMEARAHVAFGNSDYSKAYREAQQEYLDLIDSKTEYVVNRTSAQIEELSNKLQLLEDSKPQEWIRISDIESYYASRSTLLQNQVSVYQKALEDVSDLTDEQIKDLVDGLNEATIALHEAKINALEDKTELQEKQYDAIVYRINLYKDELQDAIDAIEQAYEDEIKPLERANQERARAIELENLLLAKKNANKEKERVNQNMLSIKMAI